MSFQDQVPVLGLILERLLMVLKPKVSTAGGFTRAAYNMWINALNFVLIAQLVERMAVNHDVVGSSPTGNAKCPRSFRTDRESSIFTDI